MTLLRELRRLPPLETALIALGIAILVWLTAASQAPEGDAPHLDSFSSFDAASGGYRAFYEMLAAERVPVSRFERRPAAPVTRKDGAPVYEWHPAGDAAVSLRLLRLLQDVATTVDNPALRARLAARGAPIVTGCRARLPPDDVARLDRRLAAL